VTSENPVKISDFGLAQVMGKDDYYILQTNRNLPIKWTRKFKRWQVFVALGCVVIWCDVRDFQPWRG